MISKLITFTIYLGLLLSVLASAGAQYYLWSSYDDPVNFFWQQPRENTFRRQFAYVSGAVYSPGVYEFETDTRVYELIDRAGGNLANADPVFVNEELDLARLVEDEETIFIPFAISQQDALPAAARQGKININNAPIGQLTGLPGVGESTAKKIIANRPYATLEDLLDVPGIGEVKLSQMRDLIVLQ